MNGITIQKSKNTKTFSNATTSPDLLAQLPTLEVMLQQLTKESVVWITPAQDKETVEIFCILDGLIEIDIDGQISTLGQNDSFYTQGLENEFSIKVLENTKIIYITNQMIFNESVSFQESMENMMHQIDDKDHYTYKHSMNVMNYSLKIMQKIDPDSNSLSDLITASLFHDVGKCNIPDEILNKTGKLTPIEMSEMIKHPLYSSSMLVQGFGKRVADIARAHHERLDGSGYPYGLKGDEIGLESRIIAVADSFDAMTSVRVYRPSVKSYMEAAIELYELPDKYDIQITSVLLELVKNGEI